MAIFFLAPSSWAALPLIFGQDWARRQVSLVSTIFEPVETSGTFELEQLLVRSHVVKEETGACTTSAVDVQDIGAQRRRTKGPMTCIFFWLCPKTHLGGARWHRIPSCGTTALFIGYQVQQGEGTSRVVTSKDDACDYGVR